MSRTRPAGPERTLTGPQALSWRLRRNALDPVAGSSVSDVAERVLALRGWPAEVAELASYIRQEQPDPGALSRALDDGELIRSYAFRGGSYVLSPDIAAVLLACRTASRVWETPRYQQQGHFAIADWQPLREAVHEALAAGPATREEISARLARVPALRHLSAAALGTGSDSLYKPLHWWGDMCFGPSRDGQATFRILNGDPRWPGLPGIDDAGPHAVALYLGSYGPATPANLEYWLTEGLSVPRRRLASWIDGLGETLTSVSVDGVASYALTADLAELDAAEPSEAVRLLPGFDPWVFAPGTADTRLLAPARRTLATRGAQLAIKGGVVSGTWRLHRDEVVVTWFGEAGPPPPAALERETERLGRIRARHLSLTLRSG